MLLESIEKKEKEIEEKTKQRKETKEYLNSKTKKVGKIHFEEKTY